ncbi:MAG: allophanate hydrolase [Hyphomicrobiales bacterium]
MHHTVAATLQAHRSGTSPEETVARTYARIRQHSDPAIFITLRDEADTIAEAKALATRGEASLPLYGVPFAVKDNIDVGGMPTTAACPDFAYTAKVDATCVARLRAAGAIVIGKTNLDQFATGLVGVRSPYGVPRNVFDAKLIPGGSSSGSGVAVAAGLVPFALGTDTAGSGRVPAALGNTVGLKPSLGMVSTAGVLPACRTLDCVSVFALTVDDAWAAFTAMAGPDIADPYTRNRPAGVLGPSPNLRIGVPINGERVFFGDQVSAAQFEAAIERFARLGALITEIDIEPFYETARLLYEGPWVAERYHVVRKLIASSPDSMHPVTREITLGGARSSAVDAFAAFYKLEDLRRVRDHIFRQIDVLLVPTMPTVYTIDQMLADPIQLNSRLGTYTNFVNLLDLAGLALPASMRPDGIPFGVTILAPGGQDAVLASLGRAFHADTGLPMGATGKKQPPLAPLPALPQSGEIAIAVVGAHMSGMALNHELKSFGARFLEAANTAPAYRLYALNGKPPARPGLLRVAQGGTSIALELWALPADGFGRFVAAIPAPLSIGTLTLSDGRTVKGFLAESDGVNDARDISEFGGWRAFVAQA